MYLTILKELSLYHFDNDKITSMIKTKLFFTIMISIISNKEALNLAKQFKGKLIYEFKYNRATTYQLTNGKYIVFPSEGDSSLLFENKVDYDNFFKSPNFPLPQNEIFYDYKKAIGNFDYDKEPFYTLIGEYLKYPATPIKNEKELNVLFEKINDSKSHDLRMIVPIGVIIGEYIKNLYELKWDMDTVYTFEPYLIPILKNKHNIHFPLWSILQEYFEMGNFDSGDFLQRRQLFVDMVNANFPNIRKRR